MHEKQGNKAHESFQSEPTPTAPTAIAPSLEQYKQFIANSAEGIWRFDIEVPVPTHWSENAQLDAFYAYGYLSECNDALAQMYGYEKADDLTGARLTDMVPRDNPQNEAYLRAFIRAGYRLTNVESVESDRAGSEKHFANSMVGVIENGAVVRAWGTQRDITAQRASEARYRALVEATEQMVWTCAPTGTFQAEQPSWAAYTGQTFDEYVQGGAIHALHPRDAQNAYEAWFAAIKNPAPFQTEHRVRRYDGVYRTFLVRAVPVFETDGRVREWVGTHIDITEQREAQIKQRRFLRDIVYSMTEGRLRLCDDATDFPAPLASAWNEENGPMDLSRSALRFFRRRIEAVTNKAGWSEERTSDLLTGAHEAAMNAVVHAGGGNASVYHNSDGDRVQVWVRDTGRGISPESLPRALEKGASTAGTLGHGFWLMLRGCDRVWLLTGESGTTVVLEQDRTPPVPAWLHGPE